MEPNPALRATFHDIVHADYFKINDGFVAAKFSCHSVADVLLDSGITILASSLTGVRYSLSLLIVQLFSNIST